MKKNKIFTIFTIFILFTIPVVNFSVAQPSTYVGVEEGDEYTWKIDFDIDGIDQLVNNTRQLIVDYSMSTPDLFGFESLTISESIEYAIETALNMIFSPGWESMNISSLFEEFIQTSVDMVFPGILPANWGDLNFSAFFDYVIDGINSTMSLGWENYTLQELTDYILPSGWENLTLLDLGFYVINELDTLDILPPGWENESISDLLEQIVLSVIPEGFSFNFIFGMVWDYLLLNISFLQYSIDDLFTPLIPPEILQYSIDDLFALIPPEILNSNNSDVIDSLTFFLDSILPPGWDSQSLTSLIDDLFDQLLIGILDPGVVSMNISTLIELLIENFVDPYLYSILSVYIGPLPLGWESLTISELLQLYVNNIIIPVWDNTVATQWNSLRSLIESSGFVSNEMGLKARVENIGNEASLSLGGPRGVSINLTIFISLDMVNWIPISTILNSFGIDLSFFTVLPILVDPSTYSNNLIALIDQMPFTGGLIIAKNYTLELYTQDIVIPINGDPNGIVISAEWTNQGLLKSATIEVSGITAFSIELEIEAPESEEIPGYEIPYILGTSFFVIIGVILIKTKQKKIRA